MRDGVVWCGWEEGGMSDAAAGVGRLSAAGAKGARPRMTGSEDTRPSLRPCADRREDHARHVLPETVENIPAMKKN